MGAEQGGQRFPFTDLAKVRSAAVVCHRNADADAYLSAYALSSLLRALEPRCSVEIVAPEGMTTLTSKLSKKFPHAMAGEDAAEYGLYVAVDVGDTELLKGWLTRMQSSPAVKVLVDHHPLRDGAPYDHLVVDEKATSAGEVVYGLFRDLGVVPDRTTAQALLEAVMFDSSHLAIAGPGGLRAAVALVDAGADLGEARRDLRSEPDYGEVLAKLKGAQRVKIWKAGDWVLATSRVGSFQAHVARSMIYLGADVAVVCGETDEETRVSMRATQRFAEATGLHLGTAVAEKLGGSMGGHGGGHPTAASYSCTAEEDEALEKTVACICEALGVKPSEID